IKTSVEGNPAKSEIGEKNNPSVQSRFFTAYRGATSTYGPTPMHKESLKIAKSQLKDLIQQLEAVSQQKIPQLGQKLSEAGAPWIEGAVLPKE
ncbi:MAG: hypothetical protein AAFP82_00525, partial [Bacteroidota bacterium]